MVQIVKKSIISYNFVGTTVVEFKIIANLIYDKSASHFLNIPNLTQFYGTQYELTYSF